MKRFSPLVLTCADMGMNYPAYGIEIPVLDSRCAKTLEALQDIQQLKGHPWHRVFSGPPASRPDLEAVHDHDFVARLFSQELDNEILRALELVWEGKYNRYNPQNAARPLSDLFLTVLSQTGATIEASRLALHHDFCFFLGGGMHHAMPSYGSGFCLVNDMVIAAHKLKREGQAHRFWFVDIDAHKGDGTAVLCAKDRDFVTFSIHMGKSWPLDVEPYDEHFKLKPSFQPSTMDIPVYPGEESEYLSKLEKGLESLERTQGLPDLVYVVAGADPYEKDCLPSSADLKLSLEQMFERDKLVFNFFKSRHRPMVWLMAGGYGPDVWQVYAQFLKWVLLEAHQ